MFTINTEVSTNEIAASVSVKNWVASTVFAASCNVIAVALNVELLTTSENCSTRTTPILSPGAT